MKKFSEIKKKQNIKKIHEDNYYQSSSNDINNKSNQQMDDETNKVKSNDINIIDFFSKLFESREISHIYHLQAKGDVRSNALHLAMGEYYETIIDMIDSLIETYQGQYGIISEYNIINSNSNDEDPLNYFINLSEFVKLNKKCINIEDTHLHNMIDEIISLIYRTIFKIKFLK